VILTEKLKIVLGKPSNLKQKLVLNKPLKVRSNHNTTSTPGIRSVKIAENQIQTTNSPTSTAQTVEILSEQSKATIQNPESQSQAVAIADPVKEYSTNSTPLQTMTTLTSTEIAATGGTTEGTNLIAGLSQEQKDLLIQKLISDNEEIKARLAVSPLPAGSPSGGLAGIANNVIGLITQVLAKVPLSENEGPNMQALMAQNWMTLMQGMMAKQLGINVTMNGSVGVPGN